MQKEKLREGAEYRRQKSTSKERIQDGDSKIERMKNDAVVYAESQMDYELQQLGKQKVRNEEEEPL